MSTKNHLIPIVLRAGLLLLLVWRIWKSRQSKRRTEKALAAVADSEARFNAFMDNTPLIALMKDEAGRIVYLSPQFAKKFHRSVEDCLGKNDFELWPAEMASKLRLNDLRVLSENRSTELIESIPAADGSITRWLTVKFPFSMGGKRFLGGMAVDITHREREEAALRDSEERFRTAFAHAAIGMALTDTENRFIQVNAAFCGITGYSGEELLSMDSISITHPEDREASLAWQAEAVGNAKYDIRIEKRYLRKDGTTIWVRNNVGVIRNSADEPLHFIKLVEDITREKKAEELARLSEERWQLALEGTNDGIWDFDARNKTVYYSARWKEMLGYKECELRNTTETWTQLVHPDDLLRANTAVEKHLNKQSPCYDVEYRLRCKDGSWKWVQARGKAIWDKDGNPLRMIGAHADITERKDAEAKLFHQASHDSLTGLASRGYFLSQLEERIAQSRAEGRPITLCLSDIDHFKGINDRHGHQAGDDVLVNLGKILREGIRHTDLAGRMGGDEFCILFANTTPVQAAEYMERVRNRFETIAFGTDTIGVFGVTASFGIAGLSPAMSSTELIADADRALYTSKEKGRNVVSVRTEVDQETPAGMLQALDALVRPRRNRPVNP